MSKGRNKKLVRAGGFMLKERHDELVEYNKQRESRGTYNHEDHYPNDYDEFIKGMIEHFGEYDYFGHQISSIMEKSTLTSVLEPRDIVRAVVEYLLYYSGSDKEIDVVNLFKEYLESPVKDRVGFLKKMADIIGFEETKQFIKQGKIT